VLVTSSRLSWPLDTNRSRTAPGTKRNIRAFFYLIVFWSFTEAEQMKMGQTDAVAERLAVKMAQAALPDIYCK
jgi:hypothetical protein